MGNFFPIKIPPGMSRNGTEYESAGRWYDGNLVRWENGTLKPIGGWQSLLPDGVHFTGVARGGIAWVDNNGFRYIAIGTHEKLYIGTGGVFTDVTPVGFVAGRADSILGPGYGAGPYGKSTYGTPRSTATLQLDASIWSFDTFGQDMVCVFDADNKIYEYNPSTSTLAQVSGSPTALAVMTTNEDFLMALGAGGIGRKIEWSDVGNDTVWTPTTTDSAGSIFLQSGGRCMAGRRVGIQNLVWTSVDVHLINFIGPPGIYAPIRIGDGCGLISRNGVAITDVAYWWGQGGFFMYNGLVQPLFCDVQDYIFRNLNVLQQAKIYATTNTRYNEITWFFPSLVSTECDSYVTYNYKEKFWYFGLQSSIARTTYVDRGVFPWPLAVDAGGVIYEMEQGFLANGASRNGQVFVQGGPVEIGNGDKVIYANLMIPDASVNPGSIQFTAKTRQAPAGPESVFGPYSLVPNAEGYVPVRFAGRQAAPRVDQIVDTDWSLGRPRLVVAAGGGR